MAKCEENSVGIVETKTIRIIDSAKPLMLESGKSLGPIDVAYETYGQLNEAGDNVVLICHALSGNAHVAGRHGPEDKTAGWWDNMVGPGKGIDTDKYFVICSNFLGGCSGTTGPTSIDPQTNKPYGLSFPIITIADMVKVQKLLLDKLGIKQVLAVIGGSMGGMQVLQWSIEYPDFIKSAIAVATTTRLGAQSIAFDAVGRNAILADPNFLDGQYHGRKMPDKGLGIARMIGHITYLSEHSMREKFGRKLKSTDNYSYEFNSEFSVETYLDYKGRSFVERFDANTYLYITKAMDYFDLEKDYGTLSEAFKNTKAKFLVTSFTSDWLFPPAQSEEIVRALIANEKDVSYCNIDSPYGHDSFLLETEVFGNFVSSFLRAVHLPDAPKPSIRKEISKALLKGDEHLWARRIDYELIESLIEPGSSVLDIGCGDGQLLRNLIVDKNIKGKGIEVDQGLVLECIKRGLGIIQHDVEKGLKNYGDKSFDYVILSQTLQTIRYPEKVFRELMRVGGKIIVSFPNFAHWRCRMQLMFAGKAPVSSKLPYSWYDSPNIHFLSLADFEQFCEDLGVVIEKKIPLLKTKASPFRFAANLLAEQVVYVTSQK